jgi:hypothetical protein
VCALRDESSPPARAGGGAAPAGPPAPPPRPAPLSRLSRLGSRPVAGPAVPSAERRPSEKRPTPDGGESERESHGQTRSQATTDRGHVALRPGLYLGLRIFKAVTF